jgi:hypothetical protein
MDEEERQRRLLDMIAAGGGQASPSHPDTQFPVPGMEGVESNSPQLVGPQTPMGEPDLPTSSPGVQSNDPDAVMPPGMSEEHIQSILSRLRDTNEFEAPEPELEMLPSEGRRMQMDPLFLEGNPNPMPSRHMYPAPIRVQGDPDTGPQNRQDMDILLSDMRKRLAGLPI